MKEQRTLLYISNCGVDARGNADPFLTQELPWLRRHFDRVLMVSYHGVADLTREAPGPIRTAAPGAAALRGALGALGDRELWRELRRLGREGKLNPVNGMKLLLFAIRGRKLHLWTEYWLRGLAEAGTTLYAYWMSYDAYGAALSKAGHPGLRFIVRGHAFDIDPGRNPMNPYLMKAFIAGQAEGLYFISHRAREQYLAYGREFTPPEKVKLAALGSGGEPVGKDREPPFWAGKGEPRVFQLVSCANILEIKQLPLLVDALAAWQGPPLHWTHLGGGPLEPELRAYAASRLGDRPGVSYEITGALSPAQVEEAYQERGFDAFVNTSAMEGVPVSIMEAMRFGIPVVAPKVGGIPELVDECFGLLYDPAGGAQAVGEALARLAALPREEALAMGRAAQKCWEVSWRSEALLPLLFPKEAARLQED